MTPRPAPGWRVEVAPHTVARWSIEAAVIEVRAYSARDARAEAVREAHRRAGVPGWKPWMRATYLRTRVLGAVQESPAPRRRSPRKPRRKATR